ncbi:DUF3325 domain-containing protein [Pseudomonas sp. S5(2021)]|nr:DUF3325 domain-containing protein [Stutzerimonas balearica]MBZ5756441.1 DUF3325 domain-containing protein [Pseudomonas sp. S5(2021)]HAV86917.1 DUF3325 domain-containing protein [Pseudomonas sp.]MBS4149278.1 DUF3325 domain-containing protein [Stutzerimonas balearica]MCZ4127249.1 DUF3325 domain-containing protein [Stutzerimonas balearica]QIJ00912.1 DUF3325 family protein [Stutzerimonas balearica]
MSMWLLAFGLAYVAMVLLSLTLSRHRGALLSAERRVPGRLALQLQATVFLGLALWACVVRQGSEIGAVLWLGQIMLAGLLLAIVMAWRVRWALPLAPVLLAGGGLQALL